MISREIERVPSRETSALQRRLDEIAHLEQLEEEGMHTHSLIKQEDPTLGKIIFVREVRKLHRRFTSRRR